MKKKKYILIGVLLGVLCLIYGLGVFYFSNHFLPNTIVNNLDVSLDDIEAANTLLEATNPKIIIKNSNSDEQISLKDLDPSIRFDASDLLKKQNKALWFLSFFSKKEYTCNKVSGQLDENKINDLINNLSWLKQENMKKPVDAHVEIKNGNAEIVPEEDGTYIDKQLVEQLIKEKVKEYFEGIETNEIDLSDKYEKASIKADDPSLQAQKQEIANKLNKTITINVYSSTQEVLSGTSLADLYKVENNKLVSNEDKVSEYISSITSYYNVSDYNYIDRSSFKNDLEDALNSDSSSSFNLIWIEESVPTTKLVEVCIAEQTLYYYENGTLILSSPVVTGNENITDGTPTGWFTVTRKTTDATLAGADYSEHVDYWIGFDSTGRIYGFHDASWRDEFGGDIYLSDPSRGCVNMPIGKISQLYDYVEIGTDVHIY